MLARIQSKTKGLSPSRVFLFSFVPIWAIYLSTATFGLPYHIDPFTNVLTAWSLASTGSPYLDDLHDLTQPSYFGNVAWMVSAGNHTVSQYPPGAALMATPLFLLHTSAEVVDLRGSNDPDAPAIPVPIPSLPLAAIASSLATALAIGFLSLTFRTMTDGTVALSAAYVAGLGTGAWAVASDALWQHGPAMLWIAVGLYLVLRQSEVGGGLAFAAAILTRPLTAVIAAGIGLWTSVEQRSIKPALRIGITSSVGLAALAGYNWLVIGTPSISGGYGSIFADRALTSGVLWYAKNLIGALIDPTHGLLVWAPFLIILLPGLRKAWLSAPTGVRGAAIGSLVYLLIQYKANRFSGGDGHFAYRYPLEALTAAAPLLMLSWRAWVARSAVRARLFKGAVILAVASQLFGAILY